MHARTFFTSLAASLALALGQPGAAQEAPVAEALPQGAVPGPALWRLKDKDTTIYLFGTVHVLPPGTQWLDQRIERALDGSDELVFEINLDQTASVQQVVLAKSKLAGTQTLRELMTPADREQYEAALEGLGLPVAAFDRIEPWMAAMTLSVLPLMSAGYKTESGVEMALSAHGEGKRKEALETVEEQIGVFDTLPLDVQLRYLDETVEAIPTTATSVNAMLAKWREGDADGLAALLNEELGNPEIYRRLLTQRNAHWADWIKQRMKQPGTVFIAVGAGHLAGPDSVQHQLAARGIEVTRIWR